MTLADYLENRRKILDGYLKSEYVSVKINGVNFIVHGLNSLTRLEQKALEEMGFILDKITLYDENDCNRGYDEYFDYYGKPRYQLELSFIDKKLADIDLSE